MIGNTKYKLTRMLKMMRLSKLHPIFKYMTESPIQSVKHIQCRVARQTQNSLNSSMRFSYLYVYGFVLPK